MTILHDSATLDPTESGASSFTQDENRAAEMPAAAGEAATQGGGSVPLPGRTHPAPNPARQPTTSRWNPWHLVPAVVWLTYAGLTAVPIDDLDSYWHVKMGQDILTHHRFTGDPAWAYGPHHPWITTQWGSEILFAVLHTTLGWNGLRLFMVACGIGILTGLTRTIRQALGANLTKHPLAWIIWAGVAYVTVAYMAQRPAALSFVFLAYLSGTMWRALTTGHWPRWWTITALTILWAQFHGYWVLVPLALAAVTALRAIEEWATTRTVTGWRRPAFLILASTAAGAITPAGLYGVTAIYTFKQAAGPYLTEWGATTLTGDASEPVALALLALTILAWARTPQRVPLIHIGWVLGWAVFAALAYRNVPAALLLTAPAMATAVITTWPDTGTRIKGTWVTRVAFGLVLIAGVFGATWSAARPPIPASVPQRLLATIAASPGPRHVLADYNLTGETITLTRPGVSVVVDGRSDRYGRAYLTPYFALIDLKPGWRHTLATYAPTDILIAHDEPLNTVLADLGWQRITHQAGINLWQRATPAKAPTSR